MSGAAHLGDLIDPVTAPRAGGGDYPILSMTMHGGLVDQASKFKKRVASEDTSQYKIVSRGQLVVGFPIDEGVLSFQGLYDQAIVSPAYGVWSARTDRVDRRFLELFLRSPNSLSFYRSKLRSTTARRRSISQDLFLSLPVHLPPLPEQRRIAAILDKVAALRRKRKRAIELLDDLTHTVFLEMFGDPVSNPKGWPVRSLGAVTEFYSGNSLPAGEKYKSQTDGYLLLKVSDLNRDGNEESIIGSSEWSPTPGTKAGTCYSSAVVFPKRGGAIATNKKRKLVRPAILDPNLMAVAPTNSGQISIDYLFAWFKNFRLEDISSGSSVPQLNKQDLSPLNICVPPYALQMKFSGISQEIAARCAAATMANEATDVLFNSLQRRAFSGQL